MEFKVLGRELTTDWPILALPAFFSEAECEQVLAAGLRNPLDVIDYGAAIEGHRKIDPAVRDSLSRWSPELPGNVAPKLRSALDLANAAHFDFALEPAPGIELLFNHYPTGGHFGWHQDLVVSGMICRKLAAVVQLTEPTAYEGGTLEFKPDPSVPVITAQRDRGTLFIFSSRVIHRASPVEKGSRHSLAGWLWGRV